MPLTLARLMIPTTPPPATVAKSDFIRMAVLAWLKDGAKPVWMQMADDIDRSEKSCRVWLDPASPVNPPAWVTKRAHDLAGQALDDVAELLDRTAAMVAALADDKHA